MLKFHKTPTCFGPHRTILREWVKPCYSYHYVLLTCTLVQVMWEHALGITSCPLSSCRCAFLAVMSGTAEICFRIVCLKTRDTGASSWLFTFVS